MPSSTTLLAGRSRTTAGQPANAGDDRAVWRTVHFVYPEKTEGQCREIIHAWLATGLLYSEGYDDPVQRRERKGLYVDDAKRPS
jgi:hypothetical protein